MGTGRAVAKDKHPPERAVTDISAEKNDDKDDKINIKDLRRTQAAWVQQYRGGAVDLLQEFVVHMDQVVSNTITEYYAKTMAICQSSGAGKKQDAR